MPLTSPSRIFISYRRDDTELAVGRLAEDLRRAFSPAQVFQDVASIDPGADFVDVLQRALDSCAAVLVVIGPNWAAAADKQGRRRLENPKDWVRREVAESLQRSDLRVFPVLVGNAGMPGEDDLPEPLQPLARRQAFELTARHWSKDVHELVEHLKRVLERHEPDVSQTPVSSTSTKPPTIAGGAARDQNEQIEAIDSAKLPIEFPVAADSSGERGALPGTRKRTWKVLGAIGATAALALLAPFAAMKYLVPPASTTGSNPGDAALNKTERSNAQNSAADPKVRSDRPNAAGSSPSSAPTTSSTAAPSANRPSGLDRIKHIVVIYAENRSFDHLYGMFPGADGVSNATPDQYIQVDHDGKPLSHLPPVWKGKEPDPAFPKEMLNKPFRIDAPPVSMSMDQLGPSPIHAYWQNQEQIAGGANNRFASMSNAGGWVMGYYDGSSMKLWQWAREYTLADHFFQAAFGGSFFNHFWLVCACTPEFPNAPQSIRAQLDEQGRLKRRPTSPASVMDGPVQVFDGQVTPDGYAVNTSQPPYQPSGVPPAANGDANLADAAGNPVPPQTRKTIGDALSAKGVSWAWYSGGWNAALADGRQDPKAKRAIIYNRDPSSPNFQAHHQPFNYFARFAPGTQDRAQHLKDGDDFLRDIDAGTLPHVALYKPVGRNTQHPSYTDVATGDRHIAGVLERLRKSPQWDRMVVIVTYDENGGYWDHVPPPRGPGWGDRWGPGSRVPAIIVSPFAKKGYVDKTPYDTTSIIKLITRRFALEPLPGVRSNAGDLTGALDLVH